jgi:predicted nucleic acid-binding protein
VNGGYLLDTNAISEPLKARPNFGFVQWLSSADEATIFLSVLTFGELRKGVELAPRAKHRDLERWLTVELPQRFEGRVLTFDLAVADRWGSADAQMKSKGRSVPIIDCMLAATASAHGLTMVTRNERDFAGLCRTFDPWTR